MSRCRPDSFLKSSQLYQFLHRSCTIAVTFSLICFFIHFDGFVTFPVEGCMDPNLESVASRRRPGWALNPRLPGCTPMGYPIGQVAMAHDQSVLEWVCNITGHCPLMWPEWSQMQQLWKANISWVLLIYYFISFSLYPAIWGKKWIHFNNPQSSSSPLPPIGHFTFYLSHCACSGVS